MRGRLPCAAALAVLLAACATAPPPPPGAFYSGRLVVRRDADDDAPARAATASFELSGSPADGQLLLTTPLGTTAGRARWSKPTGALATPSRIELDADGQVQRFGSLDAMTRQAIGQPLPLAALFDWLAGRPWPGAPARQDADRRGFEQLQWHVDLSQFAASRLVVADRVEPLPALHVRIKLDAPAAVASGATP